MPNYPTYKLGEVVDIYSGFGFPKHLQGRKTGKYPFFKVGDISKNVQAGYKHLNFCENYIDDDELRLIKGVLLPISSIVFAKIGEALKLNRRAITTNLCLIDNNAIGVKSKTEMCDDLYLYYYLTTIKLEDYSRATTVPSVRKSDIEQIPIPLPPLATQRAIVTRIESLFAELDKGVEKLKAAQQQLKVYRQAVLNDCLTKGSEKWEKVKLKDCSISVFAGGDAPKDNFSDVKTEKYNIPIYANAVKEKGLYGYTDIARVVDPCITIAGRGSGTGHTEIREEPFLPIVRLIVVIPNQKILDKRFLKYVIDCKTISITGSAIPQLTVPTVNEYEFSLPSLPTQQRIVQEIETRLSACDEVEKNIAESLQQSEALRQSILKKAFSGELVR